MKKRNILLATLICSLLLSCVACGHQENTDNPESLNGETTSVTEVATEAKPILPDTKYDGYKFRILNPKQIMATEMTGEIVNDSVYNSLLEVSEKFDIGFESIEVDSIDQSFFAAFIQAGEDAYDIANFHDCTTAQMALNGWFLNVAELPYVNTSGEWWPKYIVDALTLNGKLYYYANYSNYDSLSSTQAVFFNKSILNDNNIASPYDLVRDGSWTLEKMMEITNSIYVDTNGDGTRDNDDIVGFVVGGEPFRWAESFGIEAYKKTAADSSEITLDINTEKTYDFIDKLHRWFYSGNNGVWERFRDGTSAQNNMFSGGKAAFVSDVVGRLAPIVADTDLDYGIIPFPKLDEQQEAYHAGCNSELVHVPLWTKDTERTGAVIEAMCYAGYKNILPAYCETTLKTRYATDQDCTEMLNLVYENQTLSFAYLFANAVPNGMQYRLIMDTVKENNVASFYQENEAKELATMEMIMEFYAD